MSSHHFLSRFVAGLFVLILSSASCFVTQHQQVRAFVKSKASRSRLFYQNDTTPVYEAWTETREQSRLRNEIKEELAIAAIQNYDIEAYHSGMTTVAEDLMKQLEPLRPWSHPAHHVDLNARWSFVFTGVPTIGMKLITLLSRISCGFPPIDFHDVFLEVSRQQTQVKAIVAVKFFGVPVELNVYTSLRPDPTDLYGTHLIEKFESIHLAGIPLPTPESWHRSRDLEISYLDQDMMIARTAGGEPHFLLRHSPCSTDDDLCDIDETVTEYFREAQAKYGEKLTRSLVDRAYGHDDDNYGADIVLLIQSILAGEGNH